MKIPCLLVVLLASATWLHAADPEGFGLWKGAAVKNSGSELAGKIDDQKFAWQSLGTYGNHLIGISHREGDGSAELHEIQTDIMIVDTGEATLVVGGTMVGPKTVKPHEVRGSSIEGGETKQFQVKVDPALLEILRCPLTRSRLYQDGNFLVAEVGGLRYPVRDGLPVMLIDEAQLPAGVNSLDELKAQIQG